MAIIETNQEKENLADKILKSKTVKSAFERSVKRLLGAKVENSDEYTIISDLRMAMYEVPPQLESYKVIHRAYGNDLPTSTLNNKGIIDRSILFYDKYLSGNNVEMLFNSKADKVINSSVKFVNVENDEESDVYIDLDKLKEIEKFTSIYSRCAIVISDTTDGIENLRYKVLEPYRYLIDRGRYLVFTLLDPYKPTERSRKTYVHYELVEAFMLENGEWQQTRKRCYIDDKDYTVVVIEEYESVINPLPMLHEIYNNNYTSDLDMIKQSILVADMVETIRAVEVKLSQFSIHADQSYFEDGKVVVSDYYKILNSEFAGVEQPLYEAFQPNIRVDSYIAYKNDLLESMSLALGMSSRALGIASTNINRQVATVALLDEEKTAETINNKKNSLSRQLNAIFSLYFEDYLLDIPQYVSQSMPFKVEIVKNLRNDMSISEKVNFLYPTKTDQERDEEVVKIKFEQGIPMTINEIEDAKKYGVLSESEILLAENEE